MSRIIIPPDDKYNQELVDNVHPVDWVNPIPREKYNLVVIGAGPAGLISSIATASLGGSVALIEKNLIGGDCLNVGCVPSKSLIRPARLAHEMKNAAMFGVSSAGASSECFTAVMERVRRIRADLSSNDSAKRYSEMGVDVFLGEGRFISENSVEVGGEVLKFKKAVIASGARAVSPSIAGLDEVGYYTNETIFDITELPRELVVIGGGPIGCELAQAFSRLGSKVSIIQRGKFLPHEDDDASAILEEEFQNEGIEIYSYSKTLSAKLQEDGRKCVVFEHQGQVIEVAADAVLVGAGRAPNVDGLGLENAGVTYDRKSGITVDDNLRTSNRKIYAAGDCCMRWKFTHASDAAAQIVIKNALFKGNSKLSSLIMPWCTYTDPEIAHVGMYEHDAKQKGHKIQYYKFDMKDNDRAVADGEGIGFVKVMVKKGSDRILGATIVSKHAGELIMTITLCMTQGIGLGKVGGVIVPYPTQSEAIKQVAGLYRKSRLTPLVAKVIKWWLRIQK